MPYGDEKHNLIYNELVHMLGPDNVEDDPAVMKAFMARNPAGMHASAVSAVGQQEQYTEFIVLPGSTEDIQNVVKLANRYKFPYSITGSGQLLNTVTAVKPYWVFIDPKKMNSIQIDGKNMFAIVQPYATIAQVQAESTKYGLFHGVPGSSSQSSALSGSVFHQMHWTCWRTGIGRNLLGVEWVLPNGDILRTGTLAIPGGGWSWGEGPGPDIRGLLRGWEGHLGALGIVTRVAVKLNPWPGPRVFSTEGVQPEKKSNLPADRFKYYILNFPTFEKCIDALRDIGRCEIAGVCLQFAPWDWVCWASRSKEEFWQHWESPFWKRMRQTGHMLWVGLWGYASTKQLEYEKDVLEQIIKEYEGEIAPDEEQDWIHSTLIMNSVRDCHRNRFSRIRPLAFDVSFDSVSDVKRWMSECWAERKKYSPPLSDAEFETHKFWASDFGRTAFAEVGTIGETSPECAELMGKVTRSIIDIGMKAGTPTMYFFRQQDVVGPVFSNVHQLLSKVKKALDPNNLANPTRTINMEAMELMENKMESVVGPEDEG